MPQSHHRRGREVGCAHSTGEAAEQRGVPGGGRGGKGRSRGKRRRDAHAPDTEPGSRVEGSRRRTRGGPPGSAGTVHGPAAPHHARAAGEQLPRASPGRGAGSGRHDLDRLCGGSRQSHTRLAPADSHRCLPCHPVAADLYPQGGRPVAPVGHCCAGRQNRATSGGDRAERDLRDGLLGILLWLSTRQEPTPSAGCAVCRHRHQTDQLDFGR
jgi:hypothetical protein